jgi:hypothetical protein
MQLARREPELVAAPRKNKPRAAPENLHLMEAACGSDHAVWPRSTSWDPSGVGTGAIELGLGVASASAVRLLFEGVAVQEQLEMRYRA